MRESTIEHRTCDYAETKGWSNLKLNGPGDRGKPDRLFYRRGPEVKFVEFKAPGETLRPLQKLVMGKLAMCGFDCHVIDNIEDGKRLFDE